MTTFAACARLVNAETTDLSAPPVVPTPAELDLADFLAYENDAADSTLDYPGPGWSSDELASLHGDGHDGQFDPTDPVYWSLSEDEYRQAEHLAWLEANAGPETWHDAEVSRYGRGSLVGECRGGGF